MQIAFEHPHFYIVVFQELTKHIGRIEVEIGGCKQSALDVALFELLKRLDQDLQAAVCDKGNAKVERAAGRELFFDNGQQRSASCLRVGDELGRIVPMCE